MELMVSTPITMILSYLLDSINFAPVSSPYRNPVQAPLKSKPQAFDAPILFWTIAAVDGAK